MACSTLVFKRPNSIHVALFFIVFSGLEPRAECSNGQSGFLQGTRATTYSDLLMEVEGFLGQAGTREEVRQLELAFSAMFSTLPKNAKGRLEQPTVRYALHRFFARRGLYVRGIESGGAAWNGSSSMTVLTEHMPSYIEGVLEERLMQDGFGLHELAVLAAALKHLFRIETTQRLEAAFKAERLSVSDSLSSAQLDSTLDAYLAIYVLEGNLSNISWVMRVRSDIQRIYPGWSATQAWAQDIRGNLAYVERDRTNPFVQHNLGFSDALHVVEEINDHYGSFQDFECQDLKDVLLEHEYKSTGRVRLADFHGSRLRGVWQLAESKSFLRQLGALDESTPSDPLVVVTNYIYAKTNCVAKSSYYSVCCIDECESLREHVERELRVPEARPQDIATVVAHLPSSTVPAPRNLSQGLLQRLEDVAATHGGTVPLQGRLFSQLLHHAYPRECAYPHVSGSTNQVTTEQYRLQTGSSALATKQELYEHAKRATWHLLKDDGSTEAMGMGTEELPWSDEEELVQPRRQSGPSSARLCARLLLPMVGAAAMASSLMRILQTARAGASPQTPYKYYV